MNEALGWKWIRCTICRTWDFYILCMMHNVLYRIFVLILGTYVYICYKFYVHKKISFWRGFMRSFFIIVYLPTCRHFVIVCIWYIQKIALHLGLWWTWTDVIVQFVTTTHILHLSVFVSVTYFCVFKCHTYRDWNNLLPTRISMNIRKKCRLCTINYKNSLLHGFKNTY